LRENRQTGRQIQKIPQTAKEIWIARESSPIEPDLSLETFSIPLRNEIE
jgi:hypothetical protein